MARKKNGFTFIETIITIVVLSSSLLYLYNSYNAIINDEETRLYYDDISYIYKTNYVKNFLEQNSDIENIKRNSFVNSYIITIGSDFENLFTEKELSDNAKNSFETIINTFNINTILLVKKDLYEKCYDIDKNNDPKCESSLENLNYNLKNYVNTLSTTTFDYYIVIEYATKDKEQIKCTPGKDLKCISNYASLGI